jgi:hypothetical protein
MPSFIVKFSKLLMSGKGRPGAVVAPSIRTDMAATTSKHNQRAETEWLTKGSFMAGCDGV